MRLINFNSNILICIEDPRWESSNINEIRKIITACKCGNKSFSIKLSSDKYIKKLNSYWRGINKPTNVLSFPHKSKHKMKEVDCYLGDIVLGYETLNKESIERNLPIHKHLSHILIHGILHLEGYRHNDRREECMMQKEEIRILKKLKINNPYHLEKKYSLE